MVSQSPILSRYSGIGAVPAPVTPPEGIAATAWHYGDPLGEQRAATTGVIVVDRSDRSVIELSGAERLTWLHTISSQHIANLPDRRSAENLSLDANGRVEEHFVLTDIDEITWIDTPGTHGEGLLTFLTKMVFWAKVEPVARPDMRLLTLVGPGALSGPVAEMLRIGPDAPVYAADDLPEAHHDDEPLGFWRRMPALGALPGGSDTPLPVIDLLVPESLLPYWWERITDAGATMAGSWAFDALRVAALRPEIDIDTDDRTIPHEAGWIGGPDQLGAVHLDKGCYRGQETVARVHNLGKPPRRLVLLHLDGSADERPAPGDPVAAGTRTVGRVGTVIDHFEYGPIALALIKRTIGADTELTAAGAAASIDPDSIIEESGVQAGRAAVERLRKGPR